jgi:hypothetical protein
VRKPNGSSGLAAKTEEKPHDKRRKDTIQTEEKKY